MPTDSIPQRPCKMCTKEYPLTKEYFRSYKDKNGKYYFEHTCINCSRKIDRDYYANNPDKIKANRKRYEKKHPEKIRTAKKNWRENNPEKVKAEKQRSHVRCKEKNNKRSVDWHHANKEHANELSRNNYYENRDLRIAVVIQYQRDNPEQFRSVQHRRRALELNAEGSFTAADIVDMYEDQGGHCAYCGIGIFWNIFRDVQIEHILPLSRGGTNYPDNICLCCRDCNLSKYNRTLEEWVAIRGW